jgi:quercetin dioxygenase-like cupin family protein
MSDPISQYPPLPPDDLQRTLTISKPDTDQPLPHIGLAGNTYTITVSGKDTNGRFSVIDMHVLPGGGPAPHRHDFEETFIVVEGEVQATFRGETSTVRAGETIHIPANAPHKFLNTSDRPARLTCICSPAGQEEFFKELGVPVATRTTPPPKLDPEQRQQFMEKAKLLAPKYKTEAVKEA